MLQSGARLVNYSEFRTHAQEACTLKNSITLALLISLAAVLPSCGGDSGNAPESTPAAQAAAGPHNFRVPVWGMTIDEVAKMENGDPKNRTEDKLNYETMLAGHGVFIDYKFVDGKLVRTGLIFPELKDDNNEYIQEYEHIKELFTAQYGKPVVDSAKNATTEEIPNLEKGDAVCAGRLTYAAQWNLSGTTARLVLSGQNSACRLVMLYTPSNDPGL